MSDLPAIKNVFIIGAQSTGKTTLVNALIQHYKQSAHGDLPQPRVICEVARNAVKQLNINRDEIANSPAKSFQLQKAILEAQYEAEMNAMRDGAAWYISDRSGIDPIVYAQFLLGQKEADQLVASHAWGSLEQKMKDGLVFVCEAGSTWLVDDGTRLMPTSSEEWSRLDQAFRNFLSMREIEFVIVPRDMVNIADRVSLVANMISRVNKSPGLLVINAAGCHSDYV